MNCWWSRTSSVGMSSTWTPQAILHPNHPSWSVRFVRSNTGRSLRITVQPLLHILLPALETPPRMTDSSCPSHNRARAKMEFWVFHVFLGASVGEPLLYELPGACANGACECGVEPEVTTSHVSGITSTCFLAGQPGWVHR